ncbi:hypothetical protein [Granulicella sibirica]|uniref:Uncharacterized protein n=1 Tax=Granulicella sibirica TaxID=2479048 RepID=A0A4Q0T6K5_9BACT|nr:hypothetical protein [Granulicella sibirica]RXH57649.1 hypothetical protein GRAN_0959 [Granulicella sibirica]
MHMAPGTSGIGVAIAVPIAIWILSYYTKIHDLYNFDPNGIPGAFEPFLAKYLKITEVIIGLATGSIVLLVGSSALHGQAGHLPWFYASPLYLLAFCVLYGLAFSVWLTFHYEDYQHRGRHTKAAYALCETLGFASLFCFVLGYLWLIYRVTS